MKKSLIIDCSIPEVISLFEELELFLDFFDVDFVLNNIFFFEFSSFLFLLSLLLSLFESLFESLFNIDVEV